MLTGRNAFEILQIEYTNDEREIKKAYARLVKKYHPEDDAKNWEILRKAYQDALQYARAQNSSENRSVWHEHVIAIPDEELQSVKESDEAETDEAESDEAESEINALFEQMENKSALHRSDLFGEQEGMALREILVALEGFKQKKRNRYSDWKVIFQNKCYRDICCLDVYWHQVYEVLEEKDIDRRTMRHLMRDLQKLKTQRNKNIFVKEYSDETIKKLEKRLKNIEKKTGIKQRLSNKWVGVFLCAILCLGAGLCGTGIAWVGIELLEWLIGKLLEVINNILANGHL